MPKEFAVPVTACGLSTLGAPLDLGEVMKATIAQYNAESLLTQREQAWQ